jgi:hypothetical protein
MSFGRGNDKAVPEEEEAIEEKFGTKLGGRLTLENEIVKILYSSEKGSLKNTFENSYPKKT